MIFRSSHGRCSIKKGVLKKFRKIQRKTPVTKPEACNFIKKETLAQVFSSEFGEICKSNFFTEHLRATASGFFLDLPPIEYQLLTVLGQLPSRKIAPNLEP